MAILDDERRLNAVKFISKKDSAIDWELSDRKAYEEDIIKNADKLVMKKDQVPTIFLLNMELSARDDAMIKNAQVSGVDDDKQPKISMGSWAYTVCKVVLKDIQNPPGVKGIEMKKDGRGYVTDEVLSRLARYDIVDEIWAQYLALKGPSDEVKKEAKN